MESLKKMWFRLHKETDVWKAMKISLFPPLKSNNYAHNISINFCGLDVKTVKGHYFVLQNCRYYSNIQF